MTSLVVVPELGEWARPWDELVARCPVPSPFMRSWWLTGAGGERPRYLLVMQDGQLAGGLALEEQRRLGLPYLRMLSSGPLCPDHLDLLVRPGCAAEVAGAVAAWLRRPGPRLVDLEGIHTGSVLAGIAGDRARLEPVAQAPWVRLPADPGDYLRARPSGLRKTLRKAQARLAAEGAVHRIHRGTGVAGALDTLRILHEGQWGASSQFLPGFGRFADACRLGAHHDEVAVHEIAAGDTVVATMVSFEVAGRVSLYQSARLTDFQWRDTTTVLLAAIICDACERGFTEVDFLRGDEAYKNNFAPERRQLVRLRGASGWGGHAAAAAETAARRAKATAVRYARTRRPAA